VIEPAAFDLSCPLPIPEYPQILLAHGGGGRLMHDLLEKVIFPAFSNPVLAPRHDSAVVDLGGVRVAFTTDGYVVRPLFFPGGDIGSLAVNGTVNDLAMSGARPLYLTAGFILPEGFPLAELAAIVEAMARRAREAGVEVVAGDTKVVEAGSGPFVNTAGVGIVRAGLDISGRNARLDDAVLLTGDIGRHGVAVLSRREGVGFGTEVVSDVAPLNGLVAALLEGGIDVHVLRDPTRGGVAEALNEIAAQSRVEIELEEGALPVVRGVRSACDLLGLDPLHVASEGCALAFVPAAQAERALVILRGHPAARGACRVGEVIGAQPRVVARTPLGGRRLVDAPAGELLPRIC